MLANRSRAGIVREQARSYEEPKLPAGFIPSIPPNGPLSLQGEGWGEGADACGKSPLVGASLLANQSRRGVFREQARSYEEPKLPAGSIPSIPPNSSLSLQGEGWGEG